MQAVTDVAGPAPAAPPPATAPMRVSHLSDELLARQAARGSQRAFASLYERYYQPLYQYCRSILRHDADAQDVLQSTFTKALAALQRNQRNAPLRPWLYRIAHNEAISAIRQRQREQPAADDATDSIWQTGSVASAAEQADSRARFSTLMADLAELPERQRSALVLRELNGLAHEEIAVALQTTPSGAKQSIFEARQTLAEFAQGREMSCQDICRRISDGDGRVLRSRRVRAHLRSCPGCTAFADGISTRRSELRAFTPVLPAAAAAALLSRTLHAAGAHAAAGGVAAGGAAGSGAAAAGAGATGKAVTAAVLWKAAAGVAVLATAAAGVATLRHHRSAAPATAPSHHMTSAHHRPAHHGVGLSSANRGLTRAESVTHKTLPVAKGLRRRGLVPGRHGDAAGATAVTATPTPGRGSAVSSQHSNAAASHSATHSSSSAGSSHSQAATHPRRTVHHTPTRRRPVHHPTVTRPVQHHTHTTPSKPATR